MQNVRRRLGSTKRLNLSHRAQLHRNDNDDDDGEDGLAPAITHKQKTMMTATMTMVMKMHKTRRQWQDDTDAETGPNQIAHIKNRNELTKADDEHMMMTMNI